MPKLKNLPKVALLFETTNAYARELLIGIGDIFSAMDLGACTSPNWGPPIHHRHGSLRGTVTE